MKGASPSLLLLACTLGLSARAFVVRPALLRAPGRPRQSACPAKGGQERRERARGCSAQRSTPVRRMCLRPGDGSDDDHATSGNGFVCELLDSEQYREVNAFYKAHGYKATAKPTDTLWVLKHHPSAAHAGLVGAVRLTPQRYKPFGDILFLRSLCIAKDWRRRGLGTKLTSAATAYRADLPRYCFALEELVSLYLQAGWHEAGSDAMPRTIRARFEAVADQASRKHKSVALLCHGLPTHEASGTRNARCSATHIVLLQHANEGKRKTATGTVLEHEQLREHIRLERWVWSGRKDNEQISERLKGLLPSAESAPPTCYLVWAEQPAFHSAAHAAALRPDPSATYIILDGTWQEARAMFRKCSGARR